MDSRRVGPAVAYFVAFVAITVAAAVVFTNRQGAADVATHGTVALAAEEAIGAAAVLENGLVQAELIASSGRGDGEVLAAQLETLRAEFVARLSLLRSELDPSEWEPIAAATEPLLDRVDTAIAAVRAGRPPEVDDAAYSAAVEAIDEVRAWHFDQVLLARDSAGRVADAARFFVAFFLPLGAIAFYRRRVRREREAQELQTALEKERAVGRAKDEFIANLSHELRTPLTGIYGFALALEAEETEPVVAEYAAVIAEQASELSRMVDDLIAAGRLETGEIDFFPEQVDPVAEAHSVLTPFLRSEKDLTVSIAPGPLYTDAGRLRQVLRNLVSNAVKHGGSRIEVVGRPSEDRYVFQVMDDGPGIPGHVAERLFERYVHRGSQPLLSGSVGLGLAIAHGFAIGMGGDLTYGRVDDVTVFTLTLPARGEGSRGTSAEPARVGDVRSAMA